MKKRKRHFAAIYLSALLLTIVLLGTTAFVVYKQFFEKPVESTVQSDDESDILYVPSEDENLTVLYILKGGEKPTDAVFVLTRFLPAEEKLILLPIPGETFSQINTTKSTVYEFFRTGGALKAVDAVSKALNIPVDKYVQFDKNSFNTLIDIVGGVNYTIPYDLIFDNTETGESVILREGRQLLDGNKLRWLLTFPEFKEGEDFRTKMTAAVLTDMLNKAQSERIANTLDSSFKTIVNAVDTNITAYDYQFRKKGILNMIQPGTEPVEFKLTDGEHDDENRLVLSDRFKEDVLYWFKVEPVVEMG